jgi:hypothetical protein
MKRAVRAERLGVLNESGTQLEARIAASSGSRPRAGLEHSAHVAAEAAQGCQ